jgi:transposase
VHALIISQILAHIDFLDESIGRLSDEIENRIAPFARQRELLMSIPSVKQRAAEVLISDIGVDVTVFATRKHLASWAYGQPRQRRVRRQTRLRQDRQRQQMARSHPHRSGPLRRQNQELLPKPASSTTTPATTASPVKTPIASPNVLSDSSKRSDTP